MFRRRRPILRTAMVGGAAYVAGSHVARKSAEQAQQEAEQNAQIADLQQQQQAAAAPPTYYQQPAPPPPTYQQPAPPPPQAAAPAPPEATTAEKIEQLKQLGELRDAKVLTDAEFEAEKKKILG